MLDAISVRTAYARNGKAFWVGSLKNGRPILYVTPGTPGAPPSGSVQVRRFLWEEAGREIPHGMNVYHDCAEPRCVDLDCLKLQPIQVSAARTRQGAPASDTCRKNRHPWPASAYTFGGGKQTCALCTSEAWVARAGGAARQA